MECNTIVNKPYPKLRVEAKNSEYAKLLLDDYAGEISELSASTLYVYQQILNQGKYQEFEKSIRTIYITEMHHLKILGIIIKLLGVKPVYKTIKNNKSIPWHSNYLDYETNIKKILELDIKTEKLAIEKYKLHKRLINDKYIKEILDRIILDEEKHIECFTEIYNTIVKNKC